MRYCHSTLSTFGAILALALAGHAATPVTSSPVTSSPVTSSPVTLPLYFEANLGQAAGPAQFLARGQNYQFALAPAEVQFALRKFEARQPARRMRGDRPATPASVLACTARMRFLGANPEARLSGTEEMPGKINYLIGAGPAQWHTGVATYAKVRVAALYPGIDLIYYGNQHELEYDFTVAPGADPAAIAIHFDGVDRVATNQAGELVLTLGGGEIRQARPVLYQLVHGTRRTISSGYRLTDARTAGFAVGTYDPDLPLIIDPVFSYSTFFGGNGGDAGYSVKVDTNGNTYLAGETLSTAYQFPIPTNAFQTNFAGGGINGDAFVAKLGSSGTNLIYFTYLGGSADDAAYDLALDSAGNAYLAGFTTSTNFPTRNAFQSRLLGTPNPIYPDSAFLAELNTNGSALVYSTYLCGTSNDVATAIAVDSAGNAYITGYTFSSDFPHTNAFQNSLTGADDVFVAKFAPGGALVYSTFLGGSLSDEGQGIAADSNGCAYVTGYTISTDFPVTTNAQQTNLNNSPFAIGAYDAFLTKIGPNGTNLLYSTFLGGSDNDFGYRVAVDAAGNAYVTGSCRSLDFPTNAAIAGLAVGNNGVNAFNYDAFLSKFNPAGALVYSAHFGGSSDDAGEDLAVDPFGRVFIIGTTPSIDFPVVAPFDLFRTNNSGFNDAFVTAIDTAGSAALYSAYLGGAQNDYGLAIAVDAQSTAYVAGLTFSSDFPVSASAFRTNFVGPSGIAFLARINFFSPVLIITRAGGNLLLQWPASAPDYGLQSAPSLSPPIAWTPVQQSPVLNGGFYTVTLGPANGLAFFRLAHH